MDELNDDDDDDDDDSVGNENLYWLTSSRRQQLRVDLIDWKGKHVYAVYDNFKVDSEDTQYTLRSVGKYSGTAGLCH